MADTVTFIIVGQFTQTQVTMTQLDADSIQFDVEVLPVGDDDVIGDLRFLNFSTDVPLGNLSFQSLDGGISHNYRESANGIDDIPGSAGGFDIGVEFGDDGLKGGNDDFQSASFVINSTSPITLEDFFDFGIRLTSVGPTDGDRSGSDHGTDELQPDIEVVKKTEGMDDACPDIFVGETVTWTYTVTNPGNIALAGVVLTDDNGTPGDTTDDFNPTFTGGDTNNNGLLDSGETWTYTASGTVTAGDYHNIAEVEGNFASGNVTGSVTDSEDDCYDGIEADIKIVKKTNGTDDVCPEILVGGDVNWTYRVTNEGDVAISNVVVIDDNGTPGDNTDDFSPTFTGGDTNNNGKLDVGETWTYAASGTAEDIDYDNIAYVTGSAMDQVGNSANVSDNEDDCYEGVKPSIDIVKKTNGTDDECPVVEIGSTVTWTYAVTNDGEVDLTNVVVTDDHGTVGDTSDDFNPSYVSGDDGDMVLEVGETWHYSATGTAEEGEYHNIATVTGDAEDDYGNSDTVTDSEDDCYVGATAEIKIKKETNGTDDECPRIIVGQAVNWTYTVTNEGTVALSNVIVTDDAGTPGDTSDDFEADYQSGDTNGNNKLDVNETWIFTASGVAEEGDYDNIAEAAGNYAIGSSSGTVTDEEDDCYEGVKASVQIVKKTNGTNDVCPDILVGGDVNWTYSITNDGDLDIYNVVVTDDAGTPGDSGDDFNPAYVSGDDGDMVLEVGETWHYAASGTAEEGEYENIATVTGDATDDVNNTVEVSDEEEDCYDGLKPEINIVKTTNGTDNVCPTVVVGSTVTWGYTVTNTGDIALSNVVVVDDNGTPLDDTDDFMPTFVGGDTDGDNMLDLNETWTYQATGTATIGSYENIATVTGDAEDTFGNTDSVSDEEHDCYMGVDDAPGVRTPGFWQSPNGLQFWDGIVGNERKAGMPGFADGELLYDIVGQGDGLLIGDYNENGVEDAGEDTIFISLSMAQTLIQSNMKAQHDTRYVLGRDTVATWLNYLAGNNIGDADTDDGSPQAWIDHSVDWLLVYADTNDDGVMDLNSAEAIRANSAPWHTSSGGLVAGRLIHGALDEYNNSGSIDGVNYASDADMLM